jgi:hypothetical protein
LLLGLRSRAATFAEAVEDSLAAGAEVAGCRICSNQICVQGLLQLEQLHKVFRILDHVLSCLAQLKLIGKQAYFISFSLCLDKPLLKTATEI